MGEPSSLRGEHHKVRSWLEWGLRARNSFWTLIVLPTAMDSLLTDPAPSFTSISPSTALSKPDLILNETFYILDFLQNILFTFFFSWNLFFPRPHFLSGPFEEILYIPHISRPRDVFVFLHVPWNHFFWILMQKSLFLWNLCGLAMLLPLFLIMNVGLPNIYEGFGT